MSPLSDLRKSYEQGELDEALAANEPLIQFKQWLDHALVSAVPEPNAMTLATVAADGRPSTRIVLIKGFDARGLVWFTNYDSRKGLELAANPFAALQFHWVELERVVRIEGRVEKVAAAESDDYFQSRPLDSRLGAWASPQSQVIGGREELEAREAAVAEEFKGQTPLPRPANWGGFILLPQRLEFWQGRPSRLHDRIVYERAASNAGDWQRSRLAP